MGYIIAVVIICLGVARQRSKIVTCIMAFYLWSLIALNIGTSDYYAFEEMFRLAFDARYSLHEPGFLLLCQIMNWAGFTFVQFRMIIAAFIVFFVLNGMKAFTRHLNYALALYLIFPFGGVVSGLRHSMAVSIVIFGMRYLFIKGKPASLKYVLCVAAAMLFHYSAIIYLLFLLEKEKRIRFPVFVALIGFLFVGIAFLLKTGIVYNVVGQVLNSEKVLYWLQPANFGYYISSLYIISIILIFGVIFLLYLCRPLFAHPKTDSQLLIASPQDVDVMMKIEMLSMVSVLASIISSVVFMRIATSPLPVAYTVIAIMTALFAYGYWMGVSFLQVYQDNMLYGIF